MNVLCLFFHHKFSHQVCKFSKKESDFKFSHPSLLGCSVTSTNILSVPSLVLVLFIKENNSASWLPTSIQPAEPRFFPP